MKFSVSKISIVKSFLSEISELLSEQSKKPPFKFLSLEMCIILGCASPFSVFSQRLKKLKNQGVDRAATSYTFDHPPPTAAYKYMT